MNEEWRDVPGYYGTYQVSNVGSIRRVSSASGTTPGKVLKGSYNSNGYLIVSLSRGSIVEKKKVHRLVAETFVNGYTDGLVVNHIDGNKSNNDRRNLEWVTPSQNNVHALVNGLRTPSRGERHARHKLTVEDVVRIRERGLGGANQCYMAAEYGVTSPTINNIIHRKTWSHVP